jgi:hypothetical protein
VSLGVLGRSLSLMRALYRAVRLLDMAADLSL